MIEFNRHGNLENDLTLTCTEFKQLFGFNKERGKKIDNLFIVAHKFKQIGCETMFVFGSFVTAAEQPNDIDVCFDISNLDVKIIEKNSSLLDTYQRKKFIEYFQVDVPFFRIDNNDEKFMEFIRHDKSKNECGIIKINLKDLILYDKK